MENMLNCEFAVIKSDPVLYARIGERIMNYWMYLNRNMSYTVKDTMDIFFRDEYQKIGSVEMLREILGCSLIIDGGRRYDFQQEVFYRAKKLSFLTR